MMQPKKHVNAGKGKGIAWLRAHVGYEGEGCLIWPFNPGPYGYGMFGFNGEVLYAHRWMCEAVRGPAPTPEHQAAHSCGNGENGCVHPQHLDWKTPLENAQDKIAHGTCYAGKGRKRQKLTQEQVAEIRQCKSVAEQNAIAERFGVSASNVRKIIYGKAWTRPKRFKDFAEDDIRRIRSLKGSAPAKSVAAEYQVTPIVISRIWNRQMWTHVSDMPRLRSET